MVGSTLLAASSSAFGSAAMPYSGAQDSTENFTSDLDSFDSRRPAGLGHFETDGHAVG